MTTFRHLSTAAALATTLAAAAGPSAAGPSVVRDETLKDVGTTPVLGRGYSLATNTFQSICMKEIVKTKPSYDFRYTFKQVDESVAEEIKQSGSFEASYGANYGFFKVNGHMKGSSTTNTKTAKKTVNIVVQIDVDTYYASIDETKGELADTAVQLVRGDLPAFFDACGMYYVRSINRNSTIFAMFTFKAENEDSDSKFAAQIEAEIRGWGWSGSMKAEMSGESKRSAESKELKIVTNAAGLGKMTGTSLLAYDIDTFRQSVLTAFKATQDEDVGKVTSIEIVPWVEHLQFQALLLGNSNYTADGKRNMLVNSEFLAEVDRAARAKLNVFYKAKQCRGAIEMGARSYDDKGVSSWNIDGGVSAAAMAIKHNRVPSRTRKLEDLWKALTPEKQQLLYGEYDAFMYGGKDDLPIIIQNGRRTYRYDVDSSPLVAPTGVERALWAEAARTALESKLAPTGQALPAGLESWLAVQASAYLRANGRGKAAFGAATLDAVIEPLVDGANLKPGETFTEKLSYAEGNERRTVTTEIATKVDLVNGVWRFAFNNPGALIESRDGWYGFAAASILEHEAHADLWVKTIAIAIKDQTGIDLGEGDASFKALGDAYKKKVDEEIKGAANSRGMEDEPAPSLHSYPSFAALAQAAVVSVLQGGTDRRGEVNNDPLVITYLLKQLKTYDQQYLTREAQRLRKSDDAVLTEAEEWETAKAIYQQYKMLASQGGSVSLGGVGFFGSAEYVGAARCVRDLLRDNRYLRDSYRNIESCRRVESQLGTIQSSVVDDYCMPTLEQPAPAL
jgi:hypothetical protein